MVKNSPHSQMCHLVIVWERYYLNNQTLKISYTLSHRGMVKKRQKAGGGVDGGDVDMVGQIHLEGEP